jgi:hypothetical protein
MVQGSSDDAAPIGGTVMSSDMKKETRLALLVGALVGSTGQVDGLRVLSAEQVRDRLPFYRWTPGNAKEKDRRVEEYRKDVSFLIGRGLVRRIDDKGTIQLTIPEKPERLFLTGDQHYALAQARQILRPDAGPPLISPYALAVSIGEGRTIADNAMDVAWAVVRYLEEVGGTVDQAALTAHLEREGVPNPGEVASKAFTILDYTSDHLAQEALDPGLEFHGSGKEREVEARGVAPRQRENRRHSFGGLNAVNRQAYTPDEACERIQLIDEALAPESPIDDEQIRRLLRGAQYKIRAWQDLLNWALTDGE